MQAEASAVPHCNQTYGPGGMSRGFFLLRKLHARGQEIPETSVVRHCNQTYGPEISQRDKNLQFP
jgi:hypothetical protein